MFEDCKNPMGGYCGAKVMSRLTGMSEDEVHSVWSRVRKMHGDGLSREEILRAIRGDSFEEDSEIEI